MASLTTSNLLHLPCSIFSIGISPETALECHGRFPRDMKRDWLMNCTPVHEVPVHDVRISTRLVSLSEFNEFVDATGYRTEAENDGWGWIWHDGWVKEPGVSWRQPFRGTGNQLYNDNAGISPVLQVSWNDAERYCRWRALSQPGCRIPGEAEWEMFAGLNGLPSIESISMDHPLPVYDDARYMKDIIDRCNSPSPNASLSLVWEWVNEWYDAYPGGPVHAEFGDTYKVMRGGSLRSHAVQRTCNFRFRRCPTARSSFYGFRCAFDTEV